MPRILEQHQFIPVESVPRSRRHMYHHRPHRNPHDDRGPALPAGTHTLTPRRLLCGVPLPHRYLNLTLHQIPSSRPEWLDLRSTRVPATNRSDRGNTSAPGPIEGSKIPFSLPSLLLPTPCGTIPHHENSQPPAF